MTMVGFVFVFGWFVLVRNVLEQNQPTLARLVPGHVSRLRSALLVAWAIAILAAAAGPGTLLDAPLEWAFGAALVLPLVAAAQRWPVMWVPVFALQGTLQALFSGGDQTGLLGALAGGWRADAWLLTAIAATAGALLLVALVRERGRDARALYEAGRAFGRRLASLRLSALVPASGMGWRPYEWWLARSLARSDTPVVTRLLLGLGPATHWTTRIRDGACFVAFAAGMYALFVGTAAAFGLGPQAFLQLVVPPVSFGVLALACMPTLNAAARLYRTRQEQSLLVLLPGVPRGARLNRWLGLQMSGQFVASASWALALAAVAWALLPGGVDRRMDGWTATMATAMLPQVAWQWRDWARLSGAPGPDDLRAFSPHLLAGAAWAMHAWAGVDYLSLGLGFAAAALGYCAWRWWRMASEPTAMPIGRLAR
jgi:hypothetical protein